MREKVRGAVEYFRKLGERDTSVHSIENVVRSSHGDDGGMNSYPKSIRNYFEFGSHLQQQTGTLDLLQVVHIAVGAEIGYALEVASRLQEGSLAQKETCQP